MSTATLPLPAVTRPATVFLPREHGSWSLALEPLALGLLAAPSVAGGAFAAAVLAGFFARRPLRAAFAARHDDRRLAAREALVALTSLGLAALVEVIVLADVAALWPLLPAAALGACFAQADQRGENRSAAAELAGCASFAFVPAALATLAGRPAEAALVLAALAAARSLPTVLVVRTALRRAKGEASAGGAAAALVASLLAPAGLLALAASGVVSPVAGLAAAVLAARAAWLLGPWRPAWSARRIGQTEAVLGLLYVFAAAWPAA